MFRLGPGVVVRLEWETLLEAQYSARVANVLGDLTWVSGC